MLLLNFLCINITNQLCCSCLGLYHVQYVSTEIRDSPSKLEGAVELYYIHCLDHSGMAHSHLWQN